MQGDRSTPDRSGLVSTARDGTGLLASLAVYGVLLATLVGWTFFGN